MTADSTDGVSRRQFLQTTALGAGLLWRPIRRLTPGDASNRATPPGFPRDIKLYRTAYENWAGEIHVDAVWSAVARTPDDVARIVNWAAEQGWRVRPSGARHGWAPFNVSEGQPADAEMVIVDTITHLNKVRVDKPAQVVFAQAGALLDDIMEALEREDLGFSSIPAPGALTIAGVLAVNGHGAAVPAKGEDTTGRSYGSMSNRIVSLNAVVWDAPSRRYKVTTFHRNNPLTKAMLTSLGRVFITSVLLRTEPNVNLRCRSYTDIPNTELFAAQGSKGRTFASFVEETGRAEAIVFPFTKTSWFKTWAIAPTKPRESRRTNQPYNYPFSDNIPLAVARLARTAVTTQPSSAKQFGRTSMAASIHGLRATNTTDLWGSARLTQHYIKPSTIRAAEFGYGILTARANLQRVLHEFVTKYNSLTAAYARRGLYPGNMPLELRCTGVDDTAFLGIPGAEPPSLAATAPRPDHPEWDTVVFVNALTLVGSTGVYPFKRDLERWMVQNYSGDYATPRVEWSKGWGYTDEGGWRDSRVLDDVIPNGFRAGRTAANNWDWVAARFNELDPHRVFRSPLLDRLMP